MGQDTLRTSVPQIDDELAESLRLLAELEARLPAIRTQASQVQLVYDSGRRTVRRGVSAAIICRTPFSVAARPLVLTSGLFWVFFFVNRI